MFNITHQLYIASEVSVTEQQTYGWRYNKRLCRTPPSHKTTQCALHTVSHLLHTTQCALYTVSHLLHTTQCALHTVSHLLHTNTPNQNFMQFPVCSIWMKPFYWNYSTAQVCVPDNGNKHIHCTRAANGEVMGKNSINYSHAIRTGNELAKIKAHPKGCTKTSLHAVPSYTVGQFRTSNCVTGYTQSVQNWNLHETLKNKELELKDVSVVVIFKHYMNFQVL